MRMEFAELTRWELSQYRSVDDVLAIRSDNVLLLSTPLEEIGAIAYTLLAPKERIFWNLGEYAAFREARASYGQELLDRESTLTNLQSMLLSAGVDRSSVAASILLEGVTCYYGDTFQGNSPLDDIFLLAQRHIGFASPAERKADIERYFERQLSAFASSAVRPCSEGFVAMPTADRTDWIAKLLTAPLGLQSVQQAALMADEVGRALELSDGWRIGEELEVHWACRGGTHVALLARVKDDALPHVAKIAAFRIRVALQHCALPVLEDLKRELDTNGWALAGLADVRDELRGAIDQRLASFPIIQSNPLQCPPD